MVLLYSAILVRYMKVYPNFPVSVKISALGADRVSKEGWFTLLLTQGCSLINL